MLSNRTRHPSQSERALYQLYFIITIIHLLYYLTIYTLTVTGTTTSTSEPGFICGGVHL